MGPAAYDWQGPMISEREKLLTRVAKLLNMASGAKAIGNIEEGAAFASKAQEMLVRHGLSMSEIEAVAAKGQDPMDEETVEPESYGGHRYAKTVRWQVILAEAIASSYGGVSFYWDRSNCITFVGRNSTRPVMVYVYQLLARTGPRLMVKARKEARVAGVTQTGFEGSYMLGFAKAIRERLLQERKDLEDRLHAEAKGSTMDVSTALVRIRNEPDEARKWYRGKHFPERTPEQKAADAEAQERLTQWRREQVKAERKARKLETPAQRAKREAKEARERDRNERRWVREEEAEERKASREHSRYSVRDAIAKGYEDGKVIQITKGLPGADTQQDRRKLT